MGEIIGDKVTREVPAFPIHLNATEDRCLAEDQIALNLQCRSLMQLQSCDRVVHSSSDTSVHWMNIEYSISCLQGNAVKCICHCSLHPCTFALQQHFADECKTLQNILQLNAVAFVECSAIAATCAFEGISVHEQSVKQDACSRGEL